ncbi:DNA N-6-adenine-methyltransferase [Bradyrhizobium ottawaense]|uniref:DNA N-6-adenine-methyltransferase n=1 Tax=Bradyrhizobium ottawaense TaxID=931866 RepID=UPI0035128420
MIRYTRLGRLVRAARKSAGFTQADLAKRAHIGLSALQGVERGRGRTSSLFAVLRALGLELRGRQLPAGPIGAGLFQVRERRKLSRRKLAEVLSVSVDALVSTERGGGLVSVLESYGDAVAAKFYLAPPGEKRKFSVNQGNSTGNDLWETPAELGKQLSAAVGGFDLDPCAATTDRRKARVKAKVLLTAEDDGLAVPWRGRVFVNPPYSRGIANWVEKCWRESQRGCVVIGLVPARPDTGWWHDYIANKADVFMLKGRLKFGASRTNAPFPSAVVCWSGSPELVHRLTSAMTDAWHIPSAVPVRRRLSQQVFPNIPAE